MYSILTSSLLSRLVQQVLPHLSPNGVEHQIITTYFLLILTLSFSAVILKLVQRCSPIPTHQLTPSAFNRSIVDIYIDLNHFHLSATHHSISFLLSQFNSIVHLSSSFNQPTRLVFWCYINRDLSELSDWVHQLDQLQSHFQHGFVQVIDTSQKPSDPSIQKPLLNDLLKILHVSPPGRLYVISTFDPDICGAGIQLMKNHPNSPILSYVSPHGSSLLELNELVTKVDYLFSWEDDETIKLVEASPINNPLELEPEEFEPLDLILKAYNKSDLPLETLQDYLKLSKFNQSEILDQDLQVINYIDSVAANGIITISERFTFDLRHPTRLVVHPAKESDPPAPELVSNHTVLSSVPTEKVGLDEDNLTTTGSVNSERSSVLKSRIDLPDNLFDTNQSRQQAINTKSQVLKNRHHSLDLIEFMDGLPTKRNTNPIELPHRSKLSVGLDQVMVEHYPIVKHRHHSLDLTDVVDPPFKKNKRNHGNIGSVSDWNVQAGHTNPLKENKSNKNRGVVLQTLSQNKNGVRVEKEEEDDHQLETSTFNPELLTIKYDDEIKDLNISLEDQAITREEEGNKKIPTKFSTVWLNCSSGIMTNLITKDKRWLEQQGRSNQAMDKLLKLNLSLINNIQDHGSIFSASITQTSHLHFKSFFSPAFFNLINSSSKSVQTFKFNVRLLFNHYHQYSTSLDLNQVD